MLDMDSGLPPLPRFPGKPDTMMTSPALLEERRAALETYLNTILQSDTYRENPEMVRAVTVLLCYKALQSLILLLIIRFCSLR